MGEQSESQSKFEHKQSSFMTRKEKKRQAWAELPAFPLLFWTEIEQDMWWWLRRICGGWLLKETKLTPTA